MTPAEIIALLVEQAPALRKAGVTELELAQGVKVKLSPHIDETPVEDKKQDAEEPVGIFDDPASYGLPPGSPVPGFAALRRARERDARDD